MTKNIAKKYTAEFKESAVKLAVESSDTISAVAKGLGVKPSTLHTWVNKYHRPEEKAAAKVNDEHLYEELKRLKRENSRLKEEKEILKKAAAFFAKESH